MGAGASHGSRGLGSGGGILCMAGAETTATVGQVEHFSEIRRILERSLSFSNDLKSTQINLSQLKSTQICI